MGVEAGIVEKSGTWYSYENERMGQGRENAKVFLEENPDISDKIEFAIRESAGLIKNDDLINQEENPEAAEVDTKEALEAK